MRYRVLETEGGLFFPQRKGLFMWRYFEQTVGIGVTTSWQRVSCATEKTAWNFCDAHRDELAINKANRRVRRVIER